MSTEELLLLDVPKQLDQCSDFVVQKLETAQLGELEVQIVSCPPFPTPFTSG